MLKFLLMPEQKYGKYKWLNILVRRNAEEIREIKRMLRGLTLGLRHLMGVDSQYLIDIACSDSRDQAILDILRVFRRSHSAFACSCV
jgi:hypothetical protein